MRKAHDAATAALHDPLPPSAPPQQHGATSLSRDLLARLWAYLANAYGHQFVSAYGDAVDPAGVWARALAGLAAADIKRGLGRLGDWPPNAPQFRRLCTPTAEDLGLPSPEDAYIAAQRLHGKAVRERDWSTAHPAVHWTVQRIGTWEWSRMSSELHRREFLRWYAQALQLARDGGRFPAPPKLLPKRPDFVHPGRTAAGSSSIAQMRGALGMDSP